MVQSDRLRLRIIKGVLIIFGLIAFLLVIKTGFVKANNSSKVYPLLIVQKNHAAVCPGPGTEEKVKCHSKVVVDQNGRPLASATPSGYGPLQFNTAYSLPTTATSGNPIIAIVDAFDNPTAYSDLTYYSNYFGIPSLPQCSGPIANSSVPCFQKINQNGGTSYPRFDSGWALEIALDVQVAHAVCQNCKILLVEASSNGLLDLMIGISQAATQGANAISNSWSAGEFYGETSYDSYLNHPGIAITFASGDYGYSQGTQYPAASAYVVAVGGTTLQINSDNTYYNETVWNGSGSGCSLYESKPSWQKDNGCLKRTINDVAADADPNTGAAIYDTSGYSGWLQVGGTSLATPLIASVYALAGVQPSVQEASVPYMKSQNLHDVINGSNGTCGTYLCNARSGYDGPTGLGTPNGVEGFGGSLPSPSPTPIASPSPTSTPTIVPTPTPTVVPQPVTVTITFPKNDSSVTRNSIVTIQATTSPNATMVTFSVNNSLVCTDNSSPFTCRWFVPAKKNVIYTITAVAKDALGNTSAPSFVKVTAR